MDIFRVRDYSNNPRNYTLVNRDCVICGREFKVPKCKLKVITTCCAYCQNLALSWKKNLGKYLLCKMCDKPIWTQPKKNHSYCSKDCHNLAMSVIPSENNLGIIQTGRKKYYGSNWLEQRRRARKRDSYKCTDCGISEREYGQELSVHHIKPFVYFESYIEANKLSNLKSVCEPCHRKIHSGDNHTYKFDKDKIVFNNELNKVTMKQKELAEQTVDLLLNSELTLADISRKTGLSYTSVLRIYKGERWRELYDKPPITTNPRKKSSYSKVVKNNKDY